MEFGSERPSRNIHRPKLAHKTELWGQSSIPELVLPFVPTINERPRLGLERITVETGPLASEKLVFDKAMSLIEGEDSAVALTCPLERRGATGYDVASSFITAAHGDISAALLQGLHAELKGNDGLAADAARCVVGGFLVYVMPTTLIGMTVTMLSDAVRGIREKAEEKERRDFAATQAIAELVHRREVPETPLIINEPPSECLGIQLERPDAIEWGPEPPELPDGNPGLPDAGDGLLFSL